MVVHIRNNNQLGIMGKQSTITVHYKIWFESVTGEGIMGDGKWLLLETINKKGSLSAAATELKISYRKAWGDIKKAELLLGSHLLEKQRGGSLGGTSILTDFAKKWMELYKHFHKKMDTAFEKEVESFLNKVEKIK